MKLQRNGFDFIFLDRIYRIDGIFSPSARSPFGRRPFYPDDPVDPVQFSFKNENPFLCERSELSPNMQIDVKLYGDLKKCALDGQTDFVLTLNSGATLGDVLKMVSIPMDRCVSLINGRRATTEAVLANGDTLVLFPPISGG